MKHIQLCTFRVTVVTFTNGHLNTTINHYQKALDKVTSVRVTFCTPDVHPSAVQPQAQNLPMYLSRVLSE